MKRPKHTIALLLACAVLALATGCDNQTLAPMPSSTETAQKETSVPTETDTAKPTETKNENDIDTEARYQEARTSFANGETCAAYQALADIGTYKDSTLLKEEIYLQNQLGFITLGAVDYFRANREAFALVPAHLIDEIFADKTWIVPNYQSHSYLDYELQADHTGEVYDPLLGQKTHRYYVAGHRKRLSHWSAGYNHRSKRASLFNGNSQSRRRRIYFLCTGCSGTANRQ